MAERVVGTGSFGVVYQVFIFLYNVSLNIRIDIFCFTVVWDYQVTLFAYNALNKL